MAGNKKQGGGNGERAVLFLPAIYNEALMLLARAHEYFYHHAPREQAGMENRERTMFTSEMSRVTIRLSSVMAWLMARRAVFEGQITLEEANENYRLDCRDVCMNQHIEAESLLPDRMTELLDQTFELYLRVSRLDELNAKPESAKPEPPK